MASALEPRTAFCDARPTSRAEQRNNLDHVFLRGLFWGVVVHFVLFLPTFFVTLKWVHIYAKGVDQLTQYLQGEVCKSSRYGCTDERLRLRGSQDGNPGVSGSKPAPF